MTVKKKLIVVTISEPLYENLKRSAELSRRAYGHELALRIEYALNQFENKTLKVGQLGTRSMLPTDEIVQIQLNEQVHSRLKTLASSLNMFLKDLAPKILVESEKTFKSIANSENVVSRDKQIPN